MSIKLVAHAYDAWCKTYDRDHSSKCPYDISAVEEVVLLSMLRSMHFESVLDVATGTGRWAIKLAESGKSVTAIDASLGMLKRARQKTHRKKLDIKFHHSTLDEYCNHLESYDLVICCLALIHMPTVKVAITKLFQFVAPGGYLLISDVHPELTIPWREQSYIQINGEKIEYPVYKHALTSYGDAVIESGGRVLATIDVPVSRLGRVVPGAYILLAQAPEIL